MRRGCDVDAMSMRCGCEIDDVEDVEDVEACRADVRKERLAAGPESGVKRGSAEEESPTACSSRSRLFIARALVPMYLLRSGVAGACATQPRRTPRESAIPIARPHRALSFARLARRTVPCRLAPVRFLIPSPAGPIPANTSQLPMELPDAGAHPSCHSCALLFETRIPAASTRAHLPHRSSSVAGCVPFALRTCMRLTRGVHGGASPASLDQERPISS
jgi:hypothetical protein